MASSDIHHVTGSRTTIDDIVEWSTSKSLVMLLFECMCRVSTKYRTSFKLSKCGFFYDRFEYVGHDLMASDNTTAQSKYDLLNHWHTTKTGDKLHSSVSLCNYYNKFCPMFQVLVIPLRQLYIRYIKKLIPSALWTTEFLDLFKSLKVASTSSPVLARYDSSLPTFFLNRLECCGDGLHYHAAK